MAKHLLVQAVIIYAVGNSYQLCLFSVSISQISSQNGALMKKQYYGKTKELGFYPFFPVQKRCAKPYRHPVINNLNTNEFVWSVLLNLCLTGISEVPQKNQTQYC